MNMKNKDQYQNEQRDNHSDESTCECSHDSDDSTLIETLNLSTGDLKDVLKIVEMDCPTEGTLIRNKLKEYSQVKAVYFNYLKRECHIVHQGDIEEISAIIRTLGMNPINVNLAENEEQTLSQSFYEKYEVVRLITAGIFAALAELGHFLDWSIYIIVLCAFISIGLVGLTTYKKGWIALKNRTLNINALMSVAVTGAVLLGEFPEAAMVMFLFTLSEIIEAKSLNRAQSAIEKLLSLAPDVATIVEEGKIREVAVDKIALGSIIRIIPGGRIPLDGMLVQGYSSIDESPITGESIPVDKSVGDMVYAGSINQQGEIEYRTTTDSHNSTLAKIVQTLEDAQANEAPVERFIDRFSAIYTPVVFIIALSIAVIGPFLGMSLRDSIYNALVILIIACPCALVISTPIAIVSALTILARHGILVKGGVFVEKASHLKYLAFDKTGTLTRGKPQLVNTVFLKKELEDQTISYAMSLAIRSDHPVSGAIVRGYDGTIIEVEGFEAIPGHGTKGQIQGKIILLGNLKLMRMYAINCESELEEIQRLETEGNTLSLFAIDGELTVIFAVADTIRENSLSSIQSIIKLGITPILLSGDNQNAVTHIAAQVGIEKAYGGLLPDDKAVKIRELKEMGDTGMIGDGINDAPALAVSDIGLAMGAIGSDIAIQTANVALMDDDLSKLPYFFSLSKRTLNIIKQNIIFSLSVKSLFFIAVLIGAGSMWGAVFADVGTSLLVVLNSLRLLHIKN